MKLISLNVWGGKIYEPLIKFISERSNEIDIFCFQEVFNTSSNIKVSGEIRANLLEEIEKILPNHQHYFANIQKGLNFEGKVDFDISYGLAIFINKSIKVKECNNFFVFREENARLDDGTTLGRNVQYINFIHLGKQYTVANFHGLWDGGPKIDTPDRLKQSDKIKTFLQKINNPKILCGDFNLLPDTKSLTILEADMNNLIKDYKVTSTRSDYYTRDAKFADYTLVSRDLKINDFKVLPDPVSDHLAMYLDFD